MALNFPNERLHIFELMVNDGLSGRQAMVASACSKGLLREADKTTLWDKSASQCDCLAAANQILRHYFQHRTCDRIDFGEIAEEAWNSVVHEFETYVGVSLKKCADTQGDCCAEERENKRGSATCRQHCSILFDLVLQQIRRYP